MLSITWYQGRSAENATNPISGQTIEAGRAVTVKMTCVCDLGITLQHLISALLRHSTTLP